MLLHDMIVRLAKVAENGPTSSTGKLCAEVAYFLSSLRKEGGDVVDNGMQETTLYTYLKIIYNHGTPVLLSELDIKFNKVKELQGWGLILGQVSSDCPVFLSEAGRKILWFMQGGKL